MKTTKLLILTTLAFAITSCKTLQIEKPKESYLPSSIAPAFSDIPLKVEVDAKMLEASINKKLTGLIYEGNNLANKNLSIKIWKAQNFTFSINNNVIEYHVPLKIWSRLSWKVEKLGLSVGDNTEATGSITLNYKTSVNIDKNWAFNTKTTSSGYQWIETPKLNVAGVNIPVTMIADIVLSQCQKKISDQIDKTLTEMVDVKKYTTSAWNEAQKPMKVNDENNIWVRITPKDILLSPFTTNGNKLNIALDMTAQIESFMGVQPTANEATPLPALKPSTQQPQLFNLNIGADVTFDKIAEIAKKQLVGKTFTEGNRKITVTDLSLYGSQGKAIFMANVIGSFNGKIYFTGNLKYNATKVALEITNPEFDIKTSNVLVKSAGWLLHGVILKQLTPYLTYPVKTDIDNMTTEMNKLIANYKIVDGIVLQGKLNNVNISDLNLIPGAVRLLANVKGNIVIKVANLNL